MSSLSTPPLMEPVTDREQEVLRLMADGLSNRDIAQSLVLSVGTVKWYAKQLYSKLGVSSRTQAAARGRELGLLDETPQSDGAPTLSVRQHNLPAQVTSFVGREREIAEVMEMVGSHRLVTLAGPGGVGKTRLGLQVAARLVERVKEGVFFVDLAPLADPARVPEAVARALDIQETPGRSLGETLLDHLADRQILLFLDNFEHLMAAAPYVAEILAAAPGVRVLVTSREVLHLYGERVYTVQPLMLPDLAAGEPDVSAEAVQLFAQRARAGGSGFELTAENARPIAEICIRLDGLPLAIELAAARTRLFSPETLLDRLSSRLDALGTGPRDRHERQQTLRATLDWSFDLLDEEEQRFFASLAVFQGGCTIEAAEEVGAAGLTLDVVDALESLLDKSLLRQVDRPDGEPRFVMLETVHEYAALRLEALGETEAQRRRHAEYFLMLVERAEPKLMAGPEQLLWLQRLAAESSNLKHALDWAFAGNDVELGMRMVGSLHWFWYRLGYYEDGQRRADQAAQYIEQQPPAIRAKALLAFGGLAYPQQDQRRGREALNEALGLFREHGDLRYAAYTLLWLAALSIGKPDEYEGAITRAEEAVNILHTLDDRPGKAQGLNVIGELARIQGDDHKAEAVYQEALVLARETGDRLREQMMYENLGYIAMHAQDYVQAFRLFKRGLVLAGELKAPFWYYSTLGSLAAAVAALGEPVVGATLMSASQKLNREFGTALQPADQIEFDRFEAFVRSQLDDETFDRAWREGQALTLEQALELAREVAPPSPPP